MTALLAISHSTPSTSSTSTSSTTTNPASTSCFYPFPQSPTYGAIDMMPIMKLGKRLGEGSTSYVFSWSWLERGQKLRVAFKISRRFLEDRKEGDENAVYTRMRRCVRHEARNIADLMQMGIRRVLPLLGHGLALDGQRYYIAFPRLHGDNLFTSFIAPSSPSLLMSLASLRIFIRQLGCEFLLDCSTHGIAHADLKPTNLFFHDRETTVVDFGSTHLTANPLPFPIQSIHYRAPEVVMRRAYTPAIDMWSLGTILFQLFTRTNLFPVDRENEPELMAYMVKTLGMQPPASWVAEHIRMRNTATAESSTLPESSLPPALFTGRGTHRNEPPYDPVFQLPAPTAAHYSLNWRLRMEQIGIARSLPAAEVAALIDLIARMLIFEPTQRITPSQISQHPFVTQQFFADSPSGVGSPPAPLPLPPAAVTKRCKYGF